VTSFRLAIIDDYQQVASDYAPWDSLLDDGVKVSVFSAPFVSEEQAVAALAPFDIIVAMRERTRFPRRVLESLTNLKLLVTTGMANAAIDLEAASERGILVCGTGGSPAAAPEMTWALLLAFARNLVVEENSLRAGDWQTAVGFELEGKTLGIVGLGKIGKRIAGYAKAFGMDVLAWSQNLTAEKAAAQAVRLVSKDELFRQADILTIHLVLSPRTRGLVRRIDLLPECPRAPQQCQGGLRITRGKPNVPTCMGCKRRHVRGLYCGCVVFQLSQRRGRAVDDSGGQRDLDLGSQQQGLSGRIPALG